MIDFEKVNKLSKLLKERKYTSKEYKDTYKSIAPKGEIVKQISDDTFESSPLEEVIVRPSNYDKGERFGRKVINSTNETGKQMAPILGGMMVAPFAIGATASIAPSIGSYLSNPVITNSLNASNNFGRITNGVIGSNGVNQALGALGRSALGGMAIDTGYEAITGKPAQLGEALDVKNPVLRFGANMVSPGMFAGAGNSMAGLNMLPGVGKGVKSVLSKKGKSTVVDFIPQGNVNSYNNGINKDLEDFYNYLSDPKTIERLKFSDSELGTNYIQVIQKYLDVAKNSPNKKVFRFDENLIPDMLRTKTVGRGGASSGEFLTDPLNPDNYKMAVLNNRQPSTMGHEIKHILDLMEWTSRLSPEELAKIKGPIDVRASIKNSPRLKKLLEDNVVDYNTFKTRYKAKYPNAKEEEISKRYEYYNDPFEVNSQMHPIVQERIKTGRSGVFDYSDRASFEWDLNKAIINDGNDGALDVIYNMLIKDKQKFIDILNKYGYATVPTAIGGATMLNNKSK